MRIGIDLMGSDSAPESFFESALQVASEGFEDLVLVCYAAEEHISGMQEQLRSVTELGSSIELHSVTEVITMEDAPLVAVRRKRDSSMVKGLEHVREGRINALVTAGNTGALIAGAATRLPRFPGIERPALLALLPSVKGRVAVIDIGGNIACKPGHLWQFARMGALYQRLCGGIMCPRVGLLNIGTEAGKGTQEVQKAYHTLEHYCELEGKGDMLFVGNIEGRDAFLGEVDVLVSDGFTGNVFLKTAEGVCTFLLESLSRLFGANPPDEIRETLRTLASHIDYAEYPGAIVSGVDGALVKCHGSASSQAMASCIRGAIRMVRSDLIHEIKTSL